MYNYIMNQLENHQNRHLSPPRLVTGQPLPDIHLFDIDGKPFSLADHSGKIVIINFWSAECPWSLRADEILLRHLPAWQERVLPVTIACNAHETLEQIQQAVRQRGLPLVLHDPDQTAADAYGALTTPHVFLGDANHLLRYHGAFDNTTFRRQVPDQFYLIEAVEALLDGKLPPFDHFSAFGCAISRLKL